MKCPACKTELVSENVGAVQIDVCENGCGGIWFDKNEMESFDAGSEFFPEKLLFRGKQRSDLSIEHVKPCPRCQGEVLIRQFFDPENQVQIEQCWNCSGIWLDAGELAQIRGQAKSDAERAAVVNRYVDSVVAGTKATMDAHTKEDIARYDESFKSRSTAAMTSFGNIFRFILGRNLKGQID